jgi:serine/threonine protein phosphatase PrpC
MTDVPDPRRLVLGRPSPAASTEPRLRERGDAGSAGWRAEGASDGPFRFRAAYVVGVRHRLSAEGPEDNFAWAQRADLFVAAIADGVGSLPDSAGSANRACRAAADELLETGTPARAIDAANQAAAGGGATTVVVAALREDGSARVIRVGDSTAFMVQADGSWHEVFDRPDPERADASTYALPSDAPAVEERLVQLDAGSVLVLATDGVADPWRDGPATVAPALIEIVLRDPGPVELLTAADFARQGCHDDRTIVTLRWLPGVGQSVDAGALEGLHLDDVTAAGDEPGDQDAESGEHSPSHPGPYEQHHPEVGGENASVAEPDDHERRVQSAAQLVTGERHHPGDAQNDEEGGFPERNLAQELHHPHGSRI